MKTSATVKKKIAKILKRVDVIKLRNKLDTFTLIKIKKND